MSDLKERLLPGHVPDLESRIGSAGRIKAPAVGAEGQTRHRGRGLLEGMDLLAGVRVVESDPVYLADGEEPAVRAERDTAHPLGEWNRTPFGQRVSLVGA